MGSITNESFSPLTTNYHAGNLSLPADADNRLTAINTNTAAYDSNGNLTNASISGSSISSLTYDARNRLISAGGLSYGYDSENHRISLTSSNGTTTFVINPNAPLDQVLVKTIPNRVVTRYVYGIGLIGEDTGGNFTTYHFDHRGSTTALTDIKGNVTQRFSYGPNGEPAGFNPATSPTMFLFCGRWGVATDASGLVNMRARYYWPTISRFVNQDVLLGGLTPGISMNRFAYANGDPVNRIDPQGDFALWDDAAAITFGAAFGASGELLTQFASGKPINWSGVGRAAIAGGIGGEVALYTGGIGGGAANGFARDLLDQFSAGKNISTISVPEIIEQTTMGAAFGMIKIPEIEGLNSGGSSYLSLANRAFTNLDSGYWNINNISINTWRKIGTVNGYEGLGDNIKDLVKDNVAEMLFPEEKSNENCP